VDDFGLLYPEKEVNKFSMKFYHYTPKSNYQQMLVTQCINPETVDFPSGVEEKITRFL
jgi:hypothetical protein